ncbi:MAG: chromosome segregation SMC family protein [Candidatus Komeilibacteria bacterium]
MYLQKLEIQGFKSFANKTTLEFNRELTAIVGPNGSGKSNFSDAIRWVLGEQSLKVLRGKKSQDVIFAGSDQKARLGFAEVNLYLNNEDGTAPIDYSEVVISRRIYRDGESEYLINKNKVRLADVQMLMAKASFGQRSYSIVGQGMVDSILTSSAQERKEFFDEATGVRQFQIKREQSLNKLERAWENLQQSQQLLREIEPRLRSLTRQMKRLNERAELENELRKLQTKYYSFELDNFNKELKVQQNKAEQISNEKKRWEEELQTVQSKLEQIENENGQTDAFREIEQKYSQLIDKKNKLLSEMSVLQGKLDLDMTAQGKSNIVWLRQQSEKLTLELTAIQQQLTEAEQAQNKANDKLQAKLAEQNSIISEFDKIKEKLLAKNQNKDSQNDSDWEQQLNDIETAWRDWLKQLKQLDNLANLPALQKTGEDIADQLHDIKEKLANDKSPDADEIAYLEEKMDEFLTTKDNLVDEINQLRVTTEINRGRAEQLRGQYQQKQADKQKLDLELTSNTAESPAARQNAINQQRQELQQQLTEVEASLAIVKEKLDNFNSRAEAKQNDLIQMQKQTRECQIKLNDYNNQLQQLEIASARVETKLENLRQEINNVMPENWQPELNPEAINTDALQTKIISLNNRLALIGGIDDTVPNEYDEVKQRFEFLDDQCRDLEHSIQALKDIIKELDVKIEQQFKQNFANINEQFQKYYQVLFNGGKSALIMHQKNKDEKANDENDENENDEEQTDEKPLPNQLKKSWVDTEIEIKASPPGKKIDSINTLSGGEKAMTAIALICAIIACNPSPFVILDEVDAALDEANAARYVAIINELSDKTQFIAITHNRVTMHHASILYGITMGNDSISRLLSVNLKEAEEKYSQ